MMRSRTMRRYEIPGRLSDVLALIQVLALAQHALRGEEGLRKALQGSPESAENWTAVAQAHREFFRLNVSGGTEFPVSLVARYALPWDERGARDPLSPEFTGQLLSAAIELHDREVKRAERWSYFMPVVGAFVGAFVAGMLALLAALLRS